jgi:hypothetical protein
VEHQIKVRIELGPGMPVELATLRTPDAQKAILQAVARILTTHHDEIAGMVAEGKSGDIAAFVTPLYVDSGSDGQIPGTEFTETKAMVRLEGEPAACETVG